MKTLRTLTTVAALVFMMCSSSTAAITEPVITATVADTDTMTLLVEGFNLPKGAVYMGQPGGGAQKLNVVSASSTAIEAQLNTTEPGTYIVAIALSADQYWTGHVTVGAVGPPGPKGDTGPQGPPGLSGYRHLTLLTDFPAAPGTYFIDGTCDPGEIALSGGIDSIDGGANVITNGSYSLNESTWRIRFTNTDTVVHLITATFSCATVAP